MKPRLKAEELIKRFMKAQLRTKKSKEEAIASAIVAINIINEDNLGEHLEYWEEVTLALLNTN
jgi:hypothetical protein